MKRLIYIFVFLFCLSLQGQKTVAQLSSEYQTLFNLPAGKADMNANIDDFANQGHYYAAWNLSGLIKAWQATGDPTYFQEIQTAWTRIKGHAVPMSGASSGFLGFPAGSSSGAYYQQNGVSLWESYMFRHWIYLARVIHQSPTFKASHLTFYNDLVTFIENNVWNRFENQGMANYIYRENRYMTALWMGIAMELHIITGKSKYLTVFNNGVTGTTGLGPQAGSNIIAGFHAHPTVTNGFDFVGGYGSTSGTQDWGHFTHLIEMMVNAKDEGYYFDTREDLFVGIKNAWLDSWDDRPGAKSQGNVDGTSVGVGGGNGEYGNKPISQGAQLLLGQYYSDYQDLAEQYITPSANNFNKAMLAGMLLYNRKILNDGYPVYPENFTPYTGITPPVDPPTTTSPTYTPLSNYFTTFTPTRYVSVAGAGSHNGTSEANAWTLAEALSQATAGQNVFMKAGTYSSNGNMRFSNSGTSGNPIRLIGYTSSPNDIEIVRYGTLNRGGNIDAIGFPIIDVTGTSSSISFNLDKNYVELYNVGVNGNHNSLSKYGFNIAATYNKLVNCIAAEIGNSGSAGAGFVIRNGNNNEILQSVSFNNEGENIVIQPDSNGFANNNIIRDNDTWADNNSHPTDYHISTSYKGNDLNTCSNNIFEGNRAYRDISVSAHPGHYGNGGGSNNIWRWNTITNTRMETRYPSSTGTVYEYETFLGTDGVEVTIENGATNVTIRNSYIEFDYTALIYIVYNYGESTPPANSRNMPHDNFVYNNIFKWSGNSYGRILTMDPNTSISIANGYGEVIANNIFDGGISGINASATGHAVNMTNNVFLNSTSGSWTSGSSVTITGSNNTFHNNSYTTPGIGTTANPLFTLTGTGAERYKTQAGSPLIDSGIAVTGRTFDFNGANFVGTPDRGAFEYGVIVDPVDPPSTTTAAKKKKNYYRTLITTF